MLGIGEMNGPVGRVYEMFVKMPKREKGGEKG